MRIAFIVDSFPVLSETFILNQIMGLIDSGYQVEIFAGSRSRETKIHPQVEEYNLLKHTHYHNDKPINKFIRIVKAGYLLLLNGYKNPLVFFRSLNFLKYGKDASSLALFYKVFLFVTTGPFDIIHCHFGPNGNLGALLKEIGIKGKIITTFHGYDIRLGLNKGGEIYRRLFKYGDCFLSISDYNYRHLVMFGADPKKIVSHPVGINLKKFTFRWSGSYTKPADEPVKILTVGRLHKTKGLSYAIWTIEKLIKQNPDLHIEYQIIGSGPLKEELEELVKELKLTEVVHFLGQKSQEEVIKTLQQAHIFLLPSIAEALPISLMEAQAVGLPVVATSVGSVSEMVIDGESGFLVPKGDVGAMVEKLRYLIDHPEAWQKMGRIERKFVEKNYDIDRLNNRLVEIYQELKNEQ